MSLPFHEMTDRARVRALAFTLIELLVVISIIAVLMAILLPVVGSVQNSARKAQAKGDLLRLVTSCKMYQTDYSKYPTNSVQDAAARDGAQDAVYGDQPGGLYSSADLCNILRAIPDSNYNTNNALNSRGVVYLTGNNVKNEADPRNGFATLDVTRDTVSIRKGAMLDPWGNEYVVFLDADYNDGINQALKRFYPTNPPVTKADIGGASIGKDGAWGTKDKANPNGNGQLADSDDVTTWQ